MSHEDSSREKLFADPEEVVTFAQAYFATEYPNGERRACSPVQQLRATARSGALPDADLRAHLFKCSECFRSYRGARMGHRPQSVTRGSWWLGLKAALANLTPRRTAFTIGFLCLIVFGFTAVTLLWQTRQETPPVALNDSRQEMAALPMSSVSPITAPAATDASKSLSAAGSASMAQTTQLRRPKVARTSRMSPQLPIIEINLKEDGLLRDGAAAGDSQRVINLSRERLRLRLRMPDGSGSGRYTVTVVDAFGKPFITTTANSNGKTLTVSLDLRSLDTKKYRLCLERKGEAPDCYLIVVNEQTRRAVK